VARSTVKRLLPNSAAVAACSRARDAAKEG
jgi:hypothetical protein